MSLSERNRLREIDDGDVNFKEGGRERHYARAKVDHHPMGEAIRRLLTENGAAVNGLCLEIGNWEDYAPYFPNCEYMTLNFDTRIKLVYHRMLTVCGDGYHLPFGDSVLDAVVCIQVLQQIADPQAFLSEFNRAMKPRGKLFITVPFIYEIQCRGDRYRFTEAGVTELLKSTGFKVEAMYQAGNAYETILFMLETLKNAYGRKKENVHIDLEWIKEVDSTSEFVTMGYCALATAEK